MCERGEKRRKDGWFFVVSQLQHSGVSWTSTFERAGGEDMAWRFSKHMIA